LFSLLSFYVFWLFVGCGFRLQEIY